MPTLHKLKDYLGGVLSGMKVEYFLAGSMLDSACCASALKPEGANFTPKQDPSKSAGLVT
jgi:hypothetical protein